jgi:hypothetical protein
MRYQLWKRPPWSTTLWGIDPAYGNLYRIYDTDDQDDYRLMLGHGRFEGAEFIAESDSREALETAQKIHAHYYTKEKQ